jgi:fimbrial isopeptide formation D2 family protein/uncharacterized repeat protein (TIGR01451 family)
MLTRRISLVLLFIFACCAVLAQQPAVTLQGAPRDVLIGEELKFCVLFNNKAGTQEGFAPFVDLEFPAKGIDGPAPCDGIEFVKAEVISTTPHMPIQAIPIQAPCNNAPAFTFPHPLAPVGAVTIGGGNQFVTLPFEFGSFEPSQPDLIVEVTARVHKFADNGQPLNVKARAGFRYGSTASGTGPAIVSPWIAPAVFTPRVIILHKELLAPDNETVSGPNFPYQFAIAADIASGQQITNLVLHDCAAPGVVFDAMSQISPAGLVVLPLTGTPNCFEVSYPTITGSGAGTIKLKPKFHIVDSPPLDPLPCDVKLDNRIDVTNAAAWTPLDPRDGPGPVQIPTSAAATWRRKSIAVRKKAATTGPKPGGTINYTIDFEVSDYLRFTNIVIEDMLSAGQQIAGTPLLSVRDQYGAIVNKPFPAGTWSIGKLPVKGTYICPGGPLGCAPGMSAPATVSLGSTRIVFNVSAAMGQFAQPAPFSFGVLTGGWSLAPGGPPAAGQIVFTVKVLDQYPFAPSGSDDGFVDKHDPMNNAVHLTADGVRRVQGKNPPLTGVKCGDDSFTCLAIPGDTLAKRVVAKNGGYLQTIPNPLSPLPFTVGDEITFRLTKVIPTGDAENITVDDWLPQPALTVAGFTTTLTPCGTPPPGVNTACYKVVPPVPALTLTPPTLAANAVANSLHFTFPDFNNTANTPVTITLEMTLAVTNTPFADGLFLTNESRECELNSYGTPFCQVAVAQFQLTEPSLRIRKAVLCTEGCQKTKVIEDEPSPNDPTIHVTPVTIDPGDAAGDPVDISVDRRTVAVDRKAIVIGPGHPIVLPPKVVCTLGACPRITGTVNSTNLPSVLPGGVPNVDAGDRFTYVVAVENAGHGPKGAHDVHITDTLAPFDGAPVAGTLCVRLGDGSNVAFTGPGLTANGFDVTLTAPVDAWSAISGRNVVLISFDVQLKPAAQLKFGACYHNEATIAHYSNMANGPDFVTAGYTPPFNASADVCVKPKILTKAIVSTTEPGTLEVSPRPLTPGEIIRYRLTVAVPEGVGTFKIVDVLPPGLRFLAVPAPTVTKSGVNNPLTSITTTPSTGGNVTFDFGTIQNLDNDANCESVILEFSALALNDALNASAPPNQLGLPKDNFFDAVLNGVAVSSPKVQALVAEPRIVLTKIADPTTIQQGGSVHFAVSFQNTGTSPAYQTILEDTPQPGLVFTNVAVISSACGTFTTTPTSGGGFTLGPATIPPNCKVDLAITAVPKVECNTESANRVRIDYDSIPAPNGSAGLTPGAMGTPTGGRHYTSTAVASVAVKCPQTCDVSLKKTSTLTQTPAGLLVTYTIEITRNGDGPCECNQNKLFDNIPPQVSGISVTVPTGWTPILVGNSLQVTMQPLPAGVSTVTITGTVASLPLEQNCAIVECNDADSSNNRGCDSP